MIIWGAMAIPLMTAVILFLLFKHKIVWWEVLVPTGLSIIFILGLKLGFGAMMTTDTEYWSGWAVTSTYYEDWNERQRRTRQVCTGTGQNRSCRTETYYVTVNHPEYWQATDSNGITVRIGRSKFEELAKRWGNRKFVDLHRNYHTNDGDKYVTSFDGQESHMETMFSKHRYTNKVQASSSVFAFDEVDPKEYGLFEYPSVSTFNMQCILGPAGAEKAVSLRELQVTNAKLGRKKQVFIWILVMVDKPLEAGLAQENYWKGGNKNEFTVVVGVDKEQNIKWSHIISWTEVDQLKIDARNYVLSQGKLDLKALIGWLRPNVDKHFIRKQFADFDYLTVEPPLWTILITYIVTILVNAGISVWVIKNEFE